jgi:hypothetical protein
MRVVIDLEHLKVLTAAAYEVLKTKPEPSELDAALFVADTVIEGAETPEG